MTEYAWFSQKRADEYGYNVYEHEDGRHVNTTEVSKSETPCSVHKDLRYVGKVDRWVRSYRVDRRDELE